MESTQSSQLSNCSNQKSRDDRQATRQHLLPRSPGWCESGSPSQSAQAVESFDPSKVFSIICSASKIALGSNHELMHRIWVHFTQLEIVKKRHASAGTPPAGNVSTLQLKHLLQSPLVLPYVYHALPIIAIWKSREQSRTYADQALAKPPLVWPRFAKAQLVAG